jgi:hypothetical protein
MSKESYTICIGGGYAVQPRHKTMIIPDNYLLAFCNVKANNLKDVVDFCNNYQVNPIWTYAHGKALTDGFKEVQEIFSPIIDKVLTKKPLSFLEIDIINKHLLNTKFSLSLRKEPIEMTRFEKSFELLVPNDGQFEIQFNGVPEVDPKGAHVIITFSKQPRKPLLYDHIENGLFEIDKHFPDGMWCFYLKHKDQMIIEKKIINDGNWLNPIKVEQKVYLQKNDFGFDDLDATYSCRTFESKIAHLIWDRLNYKREDESIRHCVICGELYRKGKDGRSAYYCPKPECKVEWNNKKYGKDRYQKDPDFREKKIEQATANKHKPVKNKIIK